MKKVSKILAVVLAVLTAFSISGFAAATPLEAGNSMENAANIPEFGVEYVSTLSEAGEVDWFKFTTLEDDAYYTFTLKNYSMPYYNYGEVGNNSIAPNIYIYNVYLQQLTYAYNNSTRNLKLEPDTIYYIKVLNGDGKSTGNYSVTVNYRYDVVPNEKSNAYELPLNVSNVNTFDGWGDVDWFKFTTTVAGDYIFKLINHDLNGYDDNFPYGATDLSPNISVYNKYDLALKETNNNVSFTLTLEANTEYYIKMVMGSSYSKQEGTYELLVTAPDYSPKVLAGISVFSTPTKTIYTPGESLDTTGLVISAQYSDGTSKNVTDYTVSGFDSSTAGTKTVTVSYTEGGITKTCSFNVTVKAEKQLVSISVASMPEKTVYAVGEDFDATGLVIKAYYSDGTSATVTNYVLGLFDSSSEGTKTIVVGYSENGVAANCEFTVTVEAEKEEDDGSLFSDIIMIILGFFTVIVDVIASIFSML